MIHYHVTPITPVDALYEIAGRHFLVNHLYPQDIQRVHMIGQSILLENGAYGVWKSGKKANWPAYYDWCDPWLDYPTTWAIIPDEIDAGTQQQDALIREWPHGDRGAPVWHMDEPIDRLLKLTDEWPRVCVGSTAEYANVLSEAWCRRMDETWNEVSRHHRRLPWLHMLRGMQLSGRHWPFASGDSSDIARNHNRDQNTPRKMADRWDSMQTPGRWSPSDQQLELL